MNTIVDHEDSIVQFITTFKHIDLRKLDKIIEAFQLELDRLVNTSEKLVVGRQLFIQLGQDVNDLTMIDL
jgi:hypothetical protein